MRLQPSRGRAGGAGQRPLAFGVTAGGDVECEGVAAGMKERMEAISMGEGEEARKVTLDKVCTPW